ncbi:uncharacterized protein LOC113492295 [Trichoplusia ni]|uniref:Uncharacterized protein LOC113492295 n=1 Tax=Trichoplusia ni TaxID=7111 RepID=A0A7E5VB85_TRINI|nr:uncharacterized protein LOC113492295 [Trichoplusia ni]
MAHFKNALIAVALCILASALAANAISEETQNVVITTNEEILAQNDSGKQFDVQTLCFAKPLHNCLDCRTRLFCWEHGGVRVRCYNPFAPYCVNGRCSHIPDRGCPKV